MNVPFAIRIRIQVIMFIAKVKRLAILYFLFAWYLSLRRGARTNEYMWGRGLLVGNVPKNESLVVLCSYRRLMNLGAP